MLRALQGHIDLEDARPVLVETESNDLVISFEGVTHVHEGKRALCDASVRLIGVLSESVTEYGEGNVPRSVARSEAAPVDFVEVDDSNEAKLDVQGFKRPGKWVVWSATAQAIHVVLGSNPSFRRTAARPLN
jgi:hypothetical protein